MVKVGLTEVRFAQRLKGGGKKPRDYTGTVFHSRQREWQCTGPEVGECLECGRLLQQHGRRPEEEQQRGSGGTRGPHHMGPAGCWMLASDPQRNGEPLEDSEQGCERSDLLSIRITLAVRLRPCGEKGWQ